jgi:signal transduction histidine kinase
MTERQQVESALFEANSQLEIEVQQQLAELERTKEISDLKMRLFSMVSHEFRTPLSTILISTQLLASGDRTWSEEKQAKNLTRIQTAAKTMAQLLSDILTLSRAEAGKLEFHPEITDLASFCRQLIESVQYSIDASRPIQFYCHGVLTQASVDRKLLHSILSNLLSNALKYSSSDSAISLTLECTPQNLIFHVKDQGIGISPEDQQRLYETFHRGRNVGDIVGTGLGLAVVKTCVDLHGGHVSVHSEIGVGTTFTITLPR